MDKRQLDLVQQPLQAELLDARPLDVGQGGDQPRFLGRLEPRLAVLAIERELAVVVGVAAARRRRALDEADPGGSNR